MHGSRRVPVLRPPWGIPWIAGSGGITGFKLTLRMTESYFELVIRVRHDEMAQWSQERLARFFQAVGVAMAATTQGPRPFSVQTVAPAADASEGVAVKQRIKRIEETVDGVRRHVASLHE